MGGFGGFAQGLGTEATNISQAKRDRTQEGIAKANLAFQQRQQQLHSEHYKALERIAEQRLAATGNKPDKLTQNKLAVATIFGVDDWEAIPPEQQDKARTLLAVLESNKQILGSDVVQSPDSATGASKQRINALTGQVLSTTPNITTPGAEHDTKVAIPARKEAQQAGFAEQEKLLKMRGAEQEKLQQMRLAGQTYSTRLREAGQMARLKYRLKYQTEHPNARSSGQVGNVLAGLAVLKTSLHGGESIDGQHVAGLDSTFNVLDNPASRAKLSAVFHKLGVERDQSILSKLVPEFISDPANAAVFSQLSEPERNYLYQMQNTATAVQVLRTIEGTPRSTEALMQRYVRELSDPVMVTSSKDAKYKIALIDRDIHQAEKMLQLSAAPTALKAPLQNAADLP